MSPAIPSGLYSNTTSGISSTLNGLSVEGAAATDDLEVVAAPILTKRFIDDPVLPGGLVTLEFTLDLGEESASPATAISFTDDLDATLSGLVATGLPAMDVCGAGSTLSGTNVITLTGGSLAPGTSCTFSVICQVPALAAGEYLNTTSPVSAVVSGITAAENPATDFLTVSGLTFTKSFIDDPVSEGETVTLEYTLVNNTSSAVSNITFFEDLSSTLAGLTSTGLPLNDVCGPGSQLFGAGSLVGLLSGSLAANASCTFGVTLQLPASVETGEYPSNAGTLTADLSGNPITVAGATDVLFVLNAAVVPSEKLLTSDGFGGDNLGESVSIDGNVAVAGARLHDDSGADSGSAYVYRFDGATWNEEQELLAGDGVGGDGFGVCSVSGDVIVVGAYQADAPGLDSGAAYVYRFDGASWNEEQKLVANDGAAGDLFGDVGCVSVDGSVVAVGARGHDDNGADSGAVYVFRFDGTTWQMEQKLVASNGLAGDAFGTCSVSGEVIVVGAEQDTTAAGSQSGSVYVFRYDGASWTEEQQLIASDAAAGDFFGFGVSVDGSVIAVGARFDDDNGAESGSAYVYRYDGLAWNEEQKLLATDGETTDELGETVSVSGNVIVASSVFSDALFTDVGAAYLYYFDGVMWNQQHKLLADDRAASDRFGRASVSGDKVLVGAQLDDDPGVDSGSAYVFTVCTPASATLRNGLGINDLDLTNPSTPALGSTWSVDLDCTGHMADMAILYITNQPSSGLTLPLGEILITGNLLLKETILHAGGIVTFSIPIPPNPSLCGTQGFSQGLIFGGPGAELSNAVDVVLGE